MRGSGDESAVPISHIGVPFIAVAASATTVSIAGICAAEISYSGPIVSDGFYKSIVYWL
jgi:hypothetical protein